MYNLDLRLYSEEAIMRYQKSSAEETRCGDGKKEGREQCDDGNTVSNDGCDPECQVHVGWLHQPYTLASAVSIGCASDMNFIFHQVESGFECGVISTGDSVFSNCSARAQLQGKLPLPTNYRQPYREQSIVARSFTISLKTPPI